MQREKIKRMFRIGERIDSLININNELWHEATQIKDFDNKPKAGLSSEERVKCFLAVRKLNAKRSAVRAEIDNHFDDGVDESKINYSGE